VRPLRVRMTMRSLRESLPLKWSNGRAGCTLAIRVWLSSYMYKNYVLVVSTRMHPLFGPQTAFGFGLRPEGCPLSHAEGLKFFNIRVRLARSTGVISLIYRLSNVYVSYIYRIYFVFISRYIADLWLQRYSFSAIYARKNAFFKRKWQKIRQD